MLAALATAVHLAMSRFTTLPSSSELPPTGSMPMPAKTPPAIVARLQKEVARVVQTAEVKEHFARMGIEPVGGTAEELGNVVKRDIAKWTAVAKAANIKND